MKKALMVLVFTLLVVGMVFAGGQGDGAGGKKTVVKLWGLWNPGEPVAELYDGEVVPAFEKDNPDIDIAPTWVGRDVAKKIMAGFLSGDFPDIVEDTPYNIHPTLVLNDEALLLNDILEEKAYEKNVKFKQRISDLEWEHFRTYWMRGDKVEELPWRLSIAGGISYNKKFFKDNAITEPVTWTEFLNVCKKIQNTEEMAPLLMASDIWYYVGLWYMQTVVRMNPDKGFWNAAIDKTGKTWDQPLYLEAANLLSDLAHSGYFIDGYEGYQWPTDLIALTQGKGAMEVGGSWQVLETWQQNPDPNVFEYGFMAFPQIEGYPGTAKQPHGNVNSLAITKRSKVVEQTKRFLKFLYTDDIQERFQAVQKTTPVTPGVPPDPEFLDAYNMLNSATKIIEDYHVVLGQNGDWMTDVYVPNSNKLMFGDIAPADFVSTMKQETISYWQRK